MKSTPFCEMNPKIILRSSLERLHISYDYGKICLTIVFIVKSDYFIPRLLKKPIGYII